MEDRISASDALKILKGETSPAAVTRCDAHTVGSVSTCARYPFYNASAPSFFAPTALEFGSSPLLHATDASSLSWFA